MTDRQIDGILLLLLALSLFAAVALWLTLAFRRHRRARSIGWSAIAVVIAVAAATWRLRTGGSLLDSGVAAALAFAATLVVFAGAEARVNVTQAMLDPSKRAGSRLSHRKPKDFSSGES